MQEKFAFSTNKVYSLSRKGGDAMAESLGERIRKAREYCGMTQTELARRIKVSKQALYQIESGKTEDPGALKIRAIGLALGVNANYLLGLSDEMEGNFVPATAA